MGAKDLPMSLFLLDNYDSFTYNLYQYLSELGAEVSVARNDEITPDEIAALRPERIVISPGPKRPEDAGVSIELIRRFAGQVPILGVCLGHQCIGAAFGADVVGAGEIMHGKSSRITHGRPRRLRPASTAPSTRSATTASPSTRPRCRPSSSRPAGRTAAS